ncbi:MAG: iron complex outermembrane receptor protein, partial [Lysobacterales bacterium]
MMKPTSMPTIQRRLFFPKKKLLCIAMLSAGCGGAYAQDAENKSFTIEEIIVTATRRAQNMQDVPISVQAMTTETLDQLDVALIDDYIKYLPNVSAAYRGPGEGVIYMRGLSVGALGTQGQASIGGWPNVAVYLDEQSTQIPGRNLDVYAADLERIEVLEGPQGTLFGAGAQAGVLRYITNKPKMNETEAKFSASYGSTAHGNSNSAFEAVLNLPLIDDKLATRIVLYNENRGGYIDNVKSTFTRRGTDVGLAIRTGGRVPEDSLVINNNNIAADDINDVTYKGVRIGLAYNINDDWDVLLTQSFQEMNSSGVFYQLPFGSELQPLNPLEVTLFNQAEVKDEFSNTALTINGRLGNLDFVYNGAYLQRDSAQIADYTNYARGVWASYYQCTGYSGSSVDKCYSPSATWNDVTENQNTSHEFRITTPSESRIRVVAGLYYEKRELADDTDWQYKTVPECVIGGPDSCFYPLDPTASAKFASATLINPNQRSANSGFIDDFSRTYTQKAVYVSLDFDITESLTATFGTRYYEIDNVMLGANYGSFYCKSYGPVTVEGPCDSPPNGPFGTNLDEQTPNSSNVSDTKSRANLSWHVNDDVMLYTTWSEGFRTGGFNRGPGSGNLNDANGVAQWFVPLQYASDDLINVEFGWKTQLMDNRLQINGAIYKETWENVQTGIFAPQLGLGNLTVGLNGPEYEVNGIEVQVVWAATENLTIEGSASSNDSELTNSPALTNNNPASPTFGQPISTAFLSNGSEVSVANVFGSRGDPLANSPDFQGNIRARYEFEFNDKQAFWQLGMAHQASSLSSATSVNQFVMPSWTVYDAAIGVSMDTWRLELNVHNLTDENTSTFTNASQFIL